MRHISTIRFFHFRSSSKGQSFVELSIVVLLLMLLVAGIAEFGVLLNRYLNLLDGVREAARFNAQLNPFCPSGSTTCTPGTVDPDYYKKTACAVESVIYPVTLDAHLGVGDDILISFIAIKNGAITQRYPDSNGWSWRENGDAIPSGNDRNDCTWTGDGSGTRTQFSKQSDAFILSRMDSTAPDVSVALVELFYNYPQTLKAPFFEQAFPDPVPVYTYAIMPIKNEGP
jgi:hypothetical protein